MTWPLTDPALVERLTLSHDDFKVVLDDFMSALELPPWEDAFYDRAVAYPWSRPTGSYVLDGDQVLALDAETAQHAATAAERVPLLAIGSNGAPSTLVRKFAHLPEAERQVVVVAGDLVGFDVGPAARITPYGSLPATLFPSPGTAVRASALWVTPAQLTALTWTEMSYLLGWLQPVEFEPDAPAAAAGMPTLDRALGYVSRWGTLTADGAPLALDVLPARGRQAAGWSQAGLLDHVAASAFGDGANGRDLLRRLVDAPHALMRSLEPWMAERAAPFRHPDWRPLPGEPHPRGRS